MRPVRGKRDGSRPAGATGPKSTAVARASPAGCTRAKPMPPRPEFQGSTTASASAVPTAASTALPPASRIATPASAASRAWAATMPRRPVAAGFVTCQCWVTWGGGS